MAVVLCAGLGPKEGWLDTSRYGTEEPALKDEGLSSESPPRPLRETVTKRMLVVIVVMMLVILAPAVVAWAPLSTVKIRVVNADADETVKVWFYSFAGDIEYTERVLDHGEESTWQYRLSSGAYDLYFYYLFSGEEYREGGRRSFSVPFFSSETVNITLNNPPPWW